ncbi:MAG: ECF transporter S component [Acutalibacteraceae bacterium]
MMKNTTKNQVTKLVFSALCVAIGIVLPLAFHSVPNGGSVFLPMHIPVLLCGLVAGPVYGLVCGALTPLLSSLMTGMPPAAVLPGMLCELAAYGLVTGLLLRFVQTKSKAANLWISLIGAMICGRVVSGLLNGLIFRAGQYTLQIWVTASFVTALPGIAIQLVLIPLLVFALERAKLVELSAC